MREHPAPARSRSKCSFAADPSSGACSATAGSTSADGAAAKLPSCPFMMKSQKTVANFAKLQSAVQANGMSRRLSSAATKAREERELQQRMRSANISYDSHFALRGQKQAMEALADEDTLKRDIKKVRQRIKTSGRYLLYPEHWLIKLCACAHASCGEALSPPHKLTHARSLARSLAGDILTVVSLGFTVFVTPYEIGFLTAETTSMTLEMLNYVVFFVFLVGMVLQFFQPYRESYLVGGARVKNHRKIAIRYLRSWFALDFISTMPYELVANLAMYGSFRPSTNLGVDAAASDGSGGGTSVVVLKASTTLRLLRLLRIMRLLKLGRVARASRVASRMADNMEVRGQQQRRRRP